MEKPFLKKHYQETVLPELLKSRGYKNVQQVPKIEKIVINSGFNAEVERSYPEEVVKEISSITGQKALVTRARKSVSNFKVREGMPLGVKVTLRGTRMYDFLFRLIAVALPAIRDFQGVPSKLDGNGNYSLGVTDHSIFPEVNTDTKSKTLGLDITIVTTADTDDEARELLKLMGIPFRKRSQTTQQQTTPSNN